MRSLAEITGKILGGEELEGREVAFLKRASRHARQSERLVAVAAIAAHSPTNAALRRLSSTLERIGITDEVAVDQELCLLIGKVIKTNRSKVIPSQLFLLRLLDSKEATVRCNAIFASGLCIGETELELLRRIRMLSVNDPEREVKSNASVFLKKFTP